MEIKEITKSIAKKIYIAYDGTEHDSEFACECYELEQKQLELEKECDEKLRIYIKNSNFPTMLDLEIEKEFRLFLIQNEKDLDVFIKTYEYWFTSLGERYWEVDKETFEYPNVLCVLDFPSGRDQYRLYSFRQLFGQFYTFENEINNIINQKIGE
jgi:hypothetical protein